MATFNTSPPLQPSYNVGEILDVQVEDLGALESFELRLWSSEGAPTFLASGQADETGVAVFTAVEIPAVASGQYHFGNVDNTEQSSAFDIVAPAAPGWSAGWLLVLDLL